MQSVPGGVTNGALRVRVQDGSVQQVLTFAAQCTVWIGRDRTCDVVLQAPEVSRRHASIYTRDGELYVRDHSTYGTRVDGQPLQRGVRAVRSPASLTLGPYRLELELLAETLEVRLRMRPLRGPSPRWLGALALALAVCGAAWARHAQWRAPGQVGLAPAAPPACPAAPAQEAAHAPSVQHAVQLLRAGQRVSALHAYRALAARDESRAEFAIVARLLARELACQP